MKLIHMLNVIPKNSTTPINAAERVLLALINIGSVSPPGPENARMTVTNINIKNDTNIECDMFLASTYCILEVTTSGILLVNLSESPPNNPLDSFTRGEGVLLLLPTPAMLPTPFGDDVGTSAIPVGSVIPSGIYTILIPEGALMTTVLSVNNYTYQSTSTLVSVVSTRFLLAHTKHASQTLQT